MTASKFRQVSEIALALQLGLVFMLSGCNAASSHQQLNLTAPPKFYESEADSGKMPGQSPRSGAASDFESSLAGVATSSEIVIEVPNELVYVPGGEDIPITIYSPDEIPDLHIYTSPDILVKASTGQVKQVPSSHRVTVYLQDSMLAVCDNVTITAFKSGTAESQEAAESHGNAVTKKISLSPIQTRLKASLQTWPAEVAAQEFGAYFAEAFYVCDVNIVSDSPNEMLVYGANLETTVEYAVTQQDVDRANTADPTQEDIGFTERRRPMSFSDILAVFEYQREAKTSQQVIRWLQFAGTMAAGAGVFVSGRDYPTGVAFYNGIFLPEFEKRLLWDILLHLRNLESRSLKEIEEMPARGQIHRLVFYPRYPILGLNPKYPMYIAKIKGDATARAENIAKLGNTKDEQQAALAAILAKSAFASGAEWWESQIYLDAMATLNTAKVAKAKSAEEDARNKAAADSAQKATTSQLISSLLKDETLSTEARMLLEALLTYSQSSPTN